MILTPFGIDRSLFWNPSLESFDIPDSNSFSRVIWVPTWFLSSFLFYIPDFASWVWLLLIEAGTRNQSAQRKRSGIMMYSEAMWKLVCFLSWFWFSNIPYLIEISRTKFLLRWVECNIPNLNYCIFNFLKYLF